MFERQPQPYRAVRLRLQQVAAHLTIATATAVVLAVFATPATASSVAASSTASVGSSKGLSIAVPAMTLQGDVLIAALDVRRDASLTITPPAGWTLIRRESYSSSYPMSQALYWKMAGFVEPPMYTWGFSSGTGASGGILDTRGIDSAHPVDVSSGAVAMNTKSNTAPSVTTTAPNDLVVGLFGNTGSKAVTPPADFMEYFDVHSSSGARSTTEASGFVQTTAGAVGERVAKTAGSSSTTIGQLVALRSSTPPVLVSPPLVDGTPQVENTVTASLGAWSSPDPPTYGYRWLTCDSAGSNCTAVPGATAPTFMPTASAVGDRLRVTVTAANLAGSASATSAPSAPVSTDPPQIVSPPTASGLAQAGATLTASTGTWSSAAALSYEYQWKRCDATGANCSAVAGSSGTNYLLGAADVQSTVRVVVTATNDAGSATAMSDPSPVVTALPAAPQLLSTPALSGTAQTRSQLSVSTGTWSSADAPSYAYQWRSCDTTGSACVDIAGATAPSYSMTAADEGSTLRAAVTATNSVGSASAISPQSSVVLPLPPRSVTPPSVSGTPQVGVTLNASPGTWSSTQSPSYRYQWRRCASGAANCSDISGATAASYTPASGDANATLVVVVTALNAGGSSTVTSAPTAVVASAPVAPPPPTPASLWSAGMEQGTLADWYSPSPTESFTNDHGGGEYDSGGGGTNGDSDASSDYAHGGTWSAKQVIDTSNGASPGTRMIRWLEFRSLTAGQGAYCSVWVYIPQRVSVNGWFNLFQFKSKTQDSNYVDVFFQLNLMNRSDGSLYLRPGWGWGAENPNYPGGPYAGGSSGGKWYAPANTVSVPVGQWFRVIAYVVPSSGYQGKMMFWEDNGSGPTLIYDFENVLTGYPNTNSVNGVDTQWGVNAYANGLSPAVYSQYIDDAAISLNK